MRAASSAVSLTAHIAIGAAVVLSTVDAHPRDIGRPRQITVVLHRSTVDLPTRDVPRGPMLPGTVVVPLIPPPTIAPECMNPSQPVFAVLVPTDERRPAGGEGEVWEGPFVEEAPAILAGPLPAYPELLRQAGIQGRVVLEVVVDTTGRVDPGSLTVLSATHPGFVALARQALAATLFRPGRVHGRVVRVRVRIPIEFTLRSGTGRAR